MCNKHEANIAVCLRQSIKYEPHDSYLIPLFLSQDAMEVMGVVAVMVNLALLGMGGSVQRMFPNMTVTDRIILIVVLEVSFHSTTS